MPPSREEFERLALPLRNDLWFAALALARQEADALDLLQEAYLKAWRGWSTFTRGDNVKAWLFTILRHAWLDRCRRKRLEPAPLDPGPEPPGEPAPAAPALEEALPDDLLSSLRELSPSHQMLLLLCDIEGLSYKEIAEAMGIPIGSVMSGLHNARTRLREKLLSRRRP